MVCGIVQKVGGFVLRDFSVLSEIVFQLIGRTSAATPGQARLRGASSYHAVCLFEGGFITLSALWSTLRYPPQTKFPPEAGSRCLSLFSSGAVRLLISFVSFLEKVWKVPSNIWNFPGKCLDRSLKCDKCLEMLGKFPEKLLKNSNDCEFADHILSIDLARIWYSTIWSWSRRFVRSFLPPHPRFQVSSVKVRLSLQRAKDCSDTVYVGVKPGQMLLDLMMRMDSAHIKASRALYASLIYWFALRWLSVLCSLDS